MQQPPQRPPRGVLTCRMRLCRCAASWASALWPTRPWDGGSSQISRGRCAPLGGMCLPALAAARGAQFAPAPRRPTSLPPTPLPCPFGRPSRPAGAIKSPADLDPADFRRVGQPRFAEEAFEKVRVLGEALFAAHGPAASASRAPGTAAVHDGCQLAHRCMPASPGAFHTARPAPPHPTQNMALVRRVEAIAQRKGCSTSQLALAWVLAQGPDVVPIPGGFDRVAGWWAARCA